jgi:hypothetical protein
MNELLSPTEIGSFAETLVEQIQIEHNIICERNKGSNRGADFFNTKITHEIKNWYSGSWMTPQAFKDVVLARFLATDPKHKTTWIFSIPRLLAGQYVLRMFDSYRIHVVETATQLTQDAQHDLTTFSRVIENIAPKLRLLYVRASRPLFVKESLEFSYVELPFVDYYGSTLYCSQAYFDELFPLDS